MCFSATCLRNSTLTSNFSIWELVVFLLLFLSFVFFSSFPFCLLFLLLRHLPSFLPPPPQGLLLFPCLHILNVLLTFLLSIQLLSDCADPGPPLPMTSILVCNLLICTDDNNPAARLGDYHEAQSFCSEEDNDFISAVAELRGSDWRVSSGHGRICWSWPVDVTGSLVTCCCRLWSVSLPLILGDQLIGQLGGWFSWWFCWCWLTVVNLWMFFYGEFNRGLKEYIYINIGCDKSIMIQLSLHSYIENQRKGNYSPE